MLAAPRPASTGRFRAPGLPGAGPAPSFSPGPRLQPSPRTPDPGSRLAWDVTEGLPRPDASGRDRRSPTPAAVRKREAIRHLKSALAQHRIGLDYQPIAAASDRRPHSVEALLRWHEPDRDGYDIAELIRAAERSPVIFRLENWALDQCCRAAAAWQDARPGLRVNVNLSAREFHHTDLVSRVDRQLRAAALPAEVLALEITEASTISEFGVVSGQFQGLAEMGVERWLDDFGTGHSSLEWLSHLSLTGLKIPKTFVDRLGTERRCDVIVARVLELAHDLGLRVIAEGVEREEQLAFLLEHRCDLIQGFLFFAPMPAAELGAALAPAFGGV